MTEGGPPAGRSPWPVAAWAMTLFTLLALGVALVGNVLSRSAVLDAIALWPLAALVIPALLLGLKGGRHRALAPLVILSWLLVTVGLHLGGFDGLPSTAAAVQTDVSGLEQSRLIVSIEDLSLRLESGAFEVAPVPVGGTAGAPVIERVSGSSATALTVTDDTTRSPWFRFGEYQITLTPDVAWDLRLTVAAVNLDLREVDVTGGTIAAASGKVQLGQSQAPAVLEVAGDLEISVPADAAVRVMGTTQVPEDWTVADGEARSPVAGEGWTIRVVSGSVRIVSR